MTKALVLALPNFEEEFTIDTDASGLGMDDVPSHLNNNFILLIYLVIPTR